MRFLTRLRRFGREKRDSEDNILDTVADCRRMFYEDLKGHLGFWLPSSPARSIPANNSLSARR
jgi:hypothetical protein